MFKLFSEKKSKFIDNQKDNPKVSVIIVTYNAGYELFDCLNSLKRQTDQNFEIILIDNGLVNQNDLCNDNLSYFWIGKNIGPSAARNIGLEHAKADIIAFLDDDGIAEKNWIKNILRSFDDLNVMALRGKIIPKDISNVLNRLQSHYDLGARRINYYIDLEGNSAFRKILITTVGGFKPSLFGHEGAELSYKLQKEYPFFQIIYSPDVVIFHNYADSFSHLFKKSFRHGFMAAKLREIAPEIINYVNKFYAVRLKKSQSLTVQLLRNLLTAFVLLGKLRHGLLK